MKQNRLTQNLVSVILFLVSAVLLVGVFTFFKTCGPMEDGSWMTCHWAGNAVTGVSGVIAVLALANVIVKNDGTKAGLSLGIIANAVLNALIPGKLIQTCMMPDMQCNAVTKPAVLVFSVVTVVLALVNIILAVKKEKK